MKCPTDVNIYFMCVVYLMHSCVAVTGHVHTNGTIYKDTRGQWITMAMNPVPGAHTKLLVLLQPGKVAHFLKGSTELLSSRPLERFLVAEE